MTSYFFKYIEFPAKYNVATILQPPKSPNLSSPDPFLFRQLKSTLKDDLFDVLESIQKIIKRVLRSIPDEDCVIWEAELKRFINIKVGYFKR